LVGTRAALTAASGVEIERARWLLRRASEPGALGAALDVVLTAASDFQAGDAPGAERRLAAVTDAGPPEAQRLAWSVRALAAQALPIERHRQILERADLWARQAGTADAQVTNRSWRAWFRYRLGDCRAAARMLRVCVRRAPDAVARLRFLTDAANCALAGGDTRQACRLAGTALRRARRARRPAQEVRAHLLLRAALASLPRTRPDVEALEAIDALGFAAHATTARRTEAAIAWRQGDPAFALRILAVLRRPADVAGLSASELLSEALRAAAGGELAESRARFVAQRSRVVAAPAITAQILALLALAPDGLRPFLRGEWRKLSLPRDRREWGRRREILSLAEASSILAGRVPSSLARAISAARSAVPRLRRHGEA
jgi:hypothetical protein